MTLTTLRRNTRTATRTLKHPCFWCETPILRGEPYVSSGNVDDERRVYTITEHAVCEREMRDRGMWNFCDDGHDQGALLVEVGEATPEWLAWYAERRRES